MRRQPSAFSDQRSATVVRTRLAASHRGHAHAPAARPGFTLIEMVIVIAIIVLLVGLTIGVIATVNRSSETRTTENAIKLLDAALSEWQLSAERQFTMGTDNQPPGVRYDIQLDYPGDPLGSAERQTSILLTRMFNTSSSKEILARIDPKILVRKPDPANPAVMIVRAIDPWDKDIVIVHPGRLWTQADNGVLARDDDGTIHTQVTMPPGGTPIDVSEQRVGACVNRRICFISAGPDGKFGHLEAGAPQAQRDQAADNIFSYHLGKP